MTISKNAAKTIGINEQPIDQIGGQGVSSATRDNSIAPITVAGQKYVPAAGRHSQQKRNLAIARGAALGFTTARELHDHDRAMVLAKLKKTIDVAQAQQRNEANRKTGA